MSRLVVALLAVAALLTVAPDASAEELTFARALNIARQRAPELRAARAEVDLADAQVGLAQASYFPSVTATGTASRTADRDVLPLAAPQSPLARVTYTTATTATGAFRWTLFDFGRTWNAVDSARASLQATEARLARTDAAFVETVANGYLDVVYGERVRDIQRSIVDEREKLVQVVKALVKQTISPAVDEIRVAARVEAARRELETFEGRLAEARVALLALLALDSRHGTTFAPPHLQRPRLDSAAAAKEADERQPALMAARSDVAAEEATVSAARARYLPTISVNGDASYTANQLDQTDGWLPTRIAAGSVVVSVPIWDPSTSSRIDAAKASAARASATYDQVRRDARSEAAQSVVAVTASERVLEHARKAAENATVVAEVIRARYSRGLASMVDLIEAETTDAEARIAAVNAERAVDSSVVRLHVATGRASRLYLGP